MIKKVLAVTVLGLAPIGAIAAGGAWDGIYSCTLSASGIPTSQTYITVNGQSDGQAIFAVAAVAPTTDFYGYGIGRIQGNTFSGNTMFNRPFRMVATGSGFSGTIGVVIGGVTLTMNASCTKVW
jgi:hypothetical protein